MMHERFITEFITTQWSNIIVRDASHFWPEIRNVNFCPLTRIRGRSKSIISVIGSKINWHVLTNFFVSLTSDLSQDPRNADAMLQNKSIVIIFAQSRESWNQFVLRNAFSMRIFSLEFIASIDIETIHFTAHFLKLISTTSMISLSKR